MEAAYRRSVKVQQRQGFAPLAMQRQDSMRSLLMIVVATLFLGNVPARADTTWPQQQVTIVVPFAAGGSTDVVARLVAHHMQAKFGQPFVVQNKSGAGGGVGAGAVAKSPPDGYTLLVGTGGSQVTGPLTVKNVPFDPEKDLVPVSLIAAAPHLLVVHPSIPAKTLPELIAYLKANPDKVTYGSAGTGTGSHLVVELFQKATGTKMTHVPFRNTADNANALSGGHVQLAMDVISILLPQAQSGSLRAIAVTSKQRIPGAPEIPTVAETIGAFEVVAWVGMLAPAGTPRPIVDLLAAEVKRIVELPEVADNLRAVGAVARPVPTEQFDAFIKSERNMWRELINGLGL
jgi:tripartite-type tricarboxylate transporter receptor subunit TctC